MLFSKEVLGTRQYAVAVRLKRQSDPPTPHRIESHLRGSIHRCYSLGGPYCASKGALEE